MLDQSIAFIGAGQMARAMAGGFIAAGLCRPEKIWAADPSDDARKNFGRLVPGAHTTADNGEAVQAGEILILAVKPQAIDHVLPTLRPHLGADKLIISIAAGVRIEKLQRSLGDDVRIVRVMPNTPCLVGRSASGYALGPAATQEDADLVDQLLRAVGVAFQLDEVHLDAVTGLSGSGPAFVYRVIEALRDGGIEAGLPEEVALQLAAHTVGGAAEMVLETGESPAELTRRVCSPGGTTLAGLAALEAAGGCGALREAVVAAYRRSLELAHGK